jgi:hypothetical protein
MRTMYDAVTPAHIPASAQMVAGYLNGSYAWSAADWARFPNAVKVQISTQARWTVGHVLDVETGDATPTQAVGWVQTRRRWGADPSVYCNYSTWASVRAAFQAAGVAEPHYWIARYNGVQEVYPGSVAKQHSGDVPPGIDISSVADYWPGVDPVNGGSMTLTNADAGVVIGFGAQNKVQPDPAHPTAFVSLYNVLENDPIAILRDTLSRVQALQAALGTLSAAVVALSAKVDALQAATVAPVAVVDVAAIAKAVADETYRRLQA